MVDELRSRANSGVQVNLTTESIKQTLLLVPSVGVHSVFNLQVKSFLEKTFRNDESSAELAKLRDTLLPKLISGELRIPEAESALTLALSQRERGFIVTAAAKPCLSTPAKWAL